MTVHCTRNRERTVRDFAPSRRRRRRVRRGHALLALASATIFFSAGVHSQDINRTVEFEDLGFTFPLDVGARPAGMAGAYTAVTNDAYALLYNPAGLARVKRVELSLGLEQQRKDVGSVFFGNPTGIDTRDGGMDNVSLAFPFPTYRGNLVGAIGVHRVFSSYFNIHHSGTNETTQTIDNYLFQQTGSVYSYNLGVGVDLAAMLSGGVTFFLLDGSIDALRQFDFTYIDFVPETSIFVKDDAASDLDGYGGRIGVQFYVNRLLSGGISYTTPVWMKIEGSSVVEIVEHRDNAPDNYTESRAPIESEYLLPQRVDVGIVFSPSHALLAVDFGYADWTEAAIDRKRFRDSNTLETIFREVFSVRVGVEGDLPWLPLRIRAGYAYRPYALDYLQADRIDNDALTTATVNGERQQFAFGLGGLVGDMLAIDGAYSHVRGERSLATLEEERTSDRFVLTASYRF